MQGFILRRTVRQR